MKGSKAAAEKPSADNGRKPSRDVGPEYISVKEHDATVGGLVIGLTHLMQAVDLLSCHAELGGHWRRAAVKVHLDKAAAAVSDLTTDASIERAAAEFAEELGRRITPGPQRSSHRVP